MTTEVGAQKGSASQQPNDMELAGHAFDQGGTAPMTNEKKQQEMIGKTDTDHQDFHQAESE